MSRYSIVLAFVLAGCAASPVGELGQEACTDGLDNDHDGMKDCADSDCQNTVCSVPNSAVEDPGMDAGRGSTGTIAPPPVPDAGHPQQKDAAVLQEDEDSGMSPPLDMDASIGCTPACAATEACVDSGCAPVAVNMSVQFALTIDSAVAADQSALTMKCYDADCLNLSGPFCACTIDPYVLVMRIRADGTEEELGKTNPVSDTITPTFDGPTIPVDLSEGDALRFDVWDSNRAAPDRKLFSCKPDLTSPKAGSFDCSPPESTPFRPLQISATLQAL